MFLSPIAHFPSLLSGIIEDSAELVLMDPVRFKNQFNIEVRVNNEVIKIKRTREKGSSQGFE